MTANEIIEYGNILVASLMFCACAYAFSIWYKFRDQPKLRESLIDDSYKLKLMYDDSDKSLHDVTQLTISMLQYRIARENRMCSELAQLYAREIEYYKSKITKGNKGSVL